jgi:hypothetical protein
MNRAPQPRPAWFVANCSAVWRNKTCSYTGGTLRKGDRPIRTLPSAGARFILGPARSVPTIPGYELSFGNASSSASNSLRGLHVFPIRLHDGDGSKGIGVDPRGAHSEWLLRGGLSNHGTIRGPARGGQCPPNDFMGGSIVERDSSLQRSESNRVRRSSCDRHCVFSTDANPRVVRR